MNKLKLFAVGSVAALSMTSFSSFAGTANGPVPLDITIAGTCSIDTTLVDFAFGVYPAGSPDISDRLAGSVAINCATGIPYTWGVDGGNDWSGTRNMRDAANLVAYTIELGAVGTPVGDMGISAVDGSYTDVTNIAAQTGTGTGAIQTITLQGDATINAAPSGNYVDVVFFTVAWL